MPSTDTTTQNRDTIRRRHILQVVLPKDLFDEISKMADDEVRSQSSMGARLIQEAIESRKS